jgi:hypothetical protein
MPEIVARIGLKLAVLVFLHPCDCVDQPKRVKLINDYEKLTCSLAIPRRRFLALSLHSLPSVGRIPFSELLWAVFCRAQNRWESGTARNSALSFPWTECCGANHWLLNQIVSHGASPKLSQSHQRDCVFWCLYSEASTHQGFWCLIIYWFQKILEVERSQPPNKLKLSVAPKSCPLRSPWSSPPSALRCCLHS